MKKYICFSLIIFCLSSVISVTNNFYQNLQDKKAPNFELETIDGKTAKLTDFEGKVIILHFWKSN